MLTIDVFADVVCPWCYIGEQRLEKALSERPDVQAEWRWRPFQLQPQMPERGMPWADFIEKKFGGAARAEAAFRHVAAAGAADGLAFNFGRVVSAPNTVDAHRIILLGQEEGVQREAANVLFRAYFAEGADLNDRESLIRIAADAGLDEARVREMLGGSEGLAEVAESQASAQRLGISGVPFFIFNQRYALSGAQPVETFIAALDQLVEEEV